MSSNWRVLTRDEVEADRCSAYEYTFGSNSGFDIIKRMESDERSVWLRDAKRRKVFRKTRRIWFILSVKYFVAKRKFKNLYLKLARN